MAQEGLIYKLSDIHQLLYSCTALGLTPFCDLYCQDKPPHKCGVVPPSNLPVAQFAGVPIHLQRPLHELRTLYCTRSLGGSTPTPVLQTLQGL